MAQRKKRRTAAQRRATAKLVALNRARGRKKRGGTRKRTTTRRKTVKRTVKRASTGRKKVATRRRTTKRRRSTGRKTIRFSRVSGQVYRKNPRFTVRSLMGDLQRGAMDAAAVVGGKVVTRMIANVIPLPGEGMMMVYVKQAMAALGAGLAAKQFLSPQVARMVLAGGLAAPVETFLAGLPMIGGFISDSGVGEYGLGYDPSLPIGEEDPYLPIGEYAMEGGEYPAEEQGAADYEYMT